MEKQQELTLRGFEDFRRRTHASTNVRRELTVKPVSILQWYQILRLHYHWTIFEAIRFALWLTR